MLRTILSAAIVSLAGACASAQTTQPSGPNQIDPVADRILHESCDYIASTKAFSVHAEVWKDQVLDSGHKIQVTRTEDLEIRRPDRLHVDQRAHRKGRSIWYDGKTVTVLDRGTNLYGTAGAPDTIDQTLDALAENYGITVPMEDLAVADPYASAIKNVTAGGYFGDEPVLGVMCHHIGFSTDRIDWQLWVATGAAPLPQKLVITYKNEEQCPQHTAIFSKWTMSGRASDLAFEFIPPHGSVKIPLAAEAQEHKEGKAKP